MILELLSVFQFRRPSFQNQFLISRQSLLYETLMDNGSRETPHTKATLAAPLSGRTDYPNALASCGVGLDRIASMSERASKITVERGSLSYSRRVGVIAASAG